ncbi:Hypothetical protein, putative, partial [Bodo saltans]
SFDPSQNVLDIHHFTAPQAAPHTTVPQHTNSSTDMATATTAAGAMMGECHRMMAALITAGCATSDSPIDFTIHCPATEADESFTVHHLQGGDALCICHTHVGPSSCGMVCALSGTFPVVWATSLNERLFVNAWHPLLLHIASRLEENHFLRNDEGAMTPMNRY